MPVDFHDAAERHWKDARYLFENTRFANADHLFGLFTECALKAVMRGLNSSAFWQDGMPVANKHRVHINELWDEFIMFANYRGDTRYASLLSGIPNPFMNWDISQRYCHSTAVDKEIAEDHKQAAHMVRLVLDKAFWEGVIV
ncbi:MAG: hypothetical protein HQK89_04410 [Nitrospirae bacterium]|nr:hypothetical protein [Nitrospirota bacterium]